jgi:hypothetical protein
MTLGDFNDDKLLDIATVSRSQNFPSPAPEALTILLGKGDGTFKALSDVSVGTNLGPVALVAGDFSRSKRDKKDRCRRPSDPGCANRHAVLDLAVANESDNSVSILRGEGDGTFLPTAVIKVGERPVALVTADFNKDGLTDLAALSSPTLRPSPFLPPAPGSIWILMGLGDGAFQSLPAVSVGSNASSLGVGDFNTDGVADFAVADGNGVSVLIGQGGGAFQSPSVVSPGAGAILTVADVDGNGKPDIATARRVGFDPAFLTSIFLGDGSGAFHPAPSIVAKGSRPSALVSGDVDGNDFPGPPHCRSFQQHGNSLKERRRWNLPRSRIARGRPLPTDVGDGRLQS